MFRTLFSSLVIAAVAISASILTPVETEAQVQLPTTVQLPVFRNFFYNGAVKVPDGGITKLGGVTSSAEGATSRGVPGLSNIPGVGRGFKNRGIGRDQRAGNMHVKADIIIAEELEAEHLAKAGYLPRQENSNDAIMRKAMFLSKHVGKNPNFRKQDPPSENRDSWGRR